MAGKWVILVCSNALVWLGYLFSVLATTNALNYAYVPVAFTVGTLLGMLSIGRVSLAANVMVWAFLLFCYIGSPGNALLPVTFFSVAAFSFGSLMITVTRYSQ